MTPYRSDRPPSLAELQRMVDDGRGAWLPREGEAWDAFVRRKAPNVPAWWHFIARRDHNAALAEALARGERRTAQSGLFFPLWMGLNEDDVPRDDEWRRRFVLWVDGKAVLETEVEGAPTFWARLAFVQVEGAFVALRWMVASELDAERFGEYAVKSGLVRILVEGVLACALAPPVVAPSDLVPAFSQFVRPGLDVSCLPEDVAASIREAQAALEYVGDDEDASVAGASG